MSAIGKGMKRNAVRIATHTKTPRENGAIMSLGRRRTILYAWFINHLRDRRRGVAIALCRGMNRNHKGGRTMRRTYLNAYMIRCKACGKNWREDKSIHEVAKDHPCWLTNARYNERYSPYQFPGSFRIEPIGARTFTDMKCDHRCTHAKRNLCDCSCGGINHGTHA